MRRRRQWISSMSWRIKLDFYKLGSFFSGVGRDCLSFLQFEDQVLRFCDVESSSRDVCRSLLSNSGTV